MGSSTLDYTTLVHTQLKAAALSPVCSTICLSVIRAKVQVKLSVCRLLKTVAHWLTAAAATTVQFSMCVCCIILLCANQLSVVSLRRRPFVFVRPFAAAAAVAGAALIAP